MELKEYQRLYELEQTHGWYVGTRQIILSLLNRYAKNLTGHVKILDAGCGTGGMLKSIEKYGSAIGIDVSNAALAFCKKRAQNKIIQASICHLPFKNETFDIILSLGVVYHKLVKDDYQAIRELFRISKKEGIVIITNPAYNFLWSAHDVVTHTKKRYILKEVEKLIKDSGFTILKSTYFSMFPFPYLFFQRILKNLIRGKNKAASETIAITPFMNALLIYMFKIESYMLAKFKLPLGSSVLCIGVK